MCKAINGEGVNVLSLFDGISCAKVALNRGNIKYGKYYSSEVDKYAIKISEKNHPDIIRLGDVNNWRDWDIDFSKIGFLFAGFPCQAWSVSGRQGGIKDQRGRLALVLLDIFEHAKKANPDLVFLFENVCMKKENLDFMDDLFGCKHIKINSALVSAQNRLRCYWTNIERIEQPKDRGVILADIIEDGLVGRDKSYCVDANYFKGTNLEQYLKKKRRQVVFNHLSKPLRLGALSKSMGSRVYHESGKSICLSASGGGLGGKTGLYHDDYCIRKLTVIECEKLQTLPCNYTQGVSNSQRYKVLGNGWTVDVIVHILKSIPV